MPWIKRAAPAACACLVLVFALFPLTCSAATLQPVLTSELDWTLDEPTGSVWHATTRISAGTVYVEQSGGLYIGQNGRVSCPWVHDTTNIRLELGNYVSEPGLYIPGDLSCSVSWDVDIVVTDDGDEYRMTASPTVSGSYGYGGTTLGNKPDFTTVTISSRPAASASASVPDNLGEYAGAFYLVDFSDDWAGAGVGRSADVYITTVVTVSGTEAEIRALTDGTPGGELSGVVTSLQSSYDAILNGLPSLDDVTISGSAVDWLASCVSLVRSQEWVQYSLVLSVTLACVALILWR